jgi:hypothetical protein
MTELLVLNAGKHELQAVSVDGTRVRTLVAGLDELPDGIVVDQRRGHVYWTNMGAPDPGSAIPGDAAYTRNGSLERADLDGSNRVTIVPRGAFTTGKQLTADFDQGVLYWCDREGMQVLCCFLDGSGLRPLVVPAVGDEAAHIERNHCVGIAVDADRRLLYWTQKGAPNAGEGRIFRAPLDLPPGMSALRRTDIELLWEDLPEPIGATSPRATRSTVRPSSRRLVHPKSSLAYTERRSDWPQSPNQRSMSPISAAASATLT